MGSICSKEEEALRKKLDVTTTFGQSCSRFVPKDHLRSMGIRTVNSVQGGDCCEIAFAVTFVGIHNFPKLSHDMERLELVDWMDKYIFLMSKAAKSTRSYISNIVNDKLMIVSNQPRSALQVALTISKIFETLDERDEDYEQMKKDRNKRRTEGGSSGSSYEGSRENSDVDDDDDAKENQQEQKPVSKKKVYDFGIACHYGIVATALASDSEGNKLTPVIVSSEICMGETLLKQTKTLGCKILATKDIADDPYSPLPDGVSRRAVGETELIEGVDEKTEIFEILWSDEQQDSAASESS